MEEIKNLILKKYPEFIFTDENEMIIEKLFQYFSRDEKFNNEKYSLKKGILLMGNVGSGKTTIMKIFKEFCTLKNMMKFTIVESKHIVREFSSDGLKTIDVYGRNSFYKTANNFNESFDKKRPFTYCFDDLGLEEINTQFYGNKTIVLAEIITDRYVCFTDNGMVTHGITNLDLPKLKELYGERVFDRMKEIFNFFSLNQKSYRK